MTPLFSPLPLRELVLKNRLVVAPMCQYSAEGGFANDWHFVHLGRFAIGGFGLVIVEATGVTPEGRISYGDLGLWDDAHIAPLKRITDFIHSQGAAAGIQLAHAGRKGSARKPWRGSGTADPSDPPDDGFETWTTKAPSAVAHSPAYAAPEELSGEGIDRLIAAFGAATRRALEAGFDVVEIHAAHGYLLNEFLSPLANRRQDRYGGALENRMRFPLEVVDEVRRNWPAAKPLFVRISASDNHPDGWTIADSVVLAQEFGRRDVDVVDCSSGGFDGAAIQPRALYQVPFAETIRREAGIGTMAIGLISEPHEAASIVADGKADLVALARTALDDPNWPLRARRHLEPGEDTYAHWPVQVGYAVRNRDRALRGS